MSHNPIAYVTPNASSVLDRSFNGDSDSSGTFSMSNLSLPKATTSLKDASLLHVSHLYWRCLTTGNNDDFPLTFDALIDDGSSVATVMTDVFRKN
jgi:hypothetical protein